jgi:hypothetical protein
LQGKQAAGQPQQQIALAQPPHPSIPLGGNGPPIASRVAEARHSPPLL